MLQLALALQWEAMVVRIRGPRKRYGRRCELCANCRVRLEERGERVYRVARCRLGLWEWSSVRYDALVTVGRVNRHAEGCAGYVAD